MSEIPERWRLLYEREAALNITTTGTDLGISRKFCMVIEELGAAEAQLLTANTTIRQLVTESDAKKSVVELRATVAQQATTIEALRKVGDDFLLRLEVQAKTIGELLRILSAIQWCMWNARDRPTYCPVCLGREATGHGVSCDIGKVLVAQLPKETPCVESSQT